MKRVTLLGGTGSVGRRTLELVSSFPEEFAVAGFAARGSNVELIADLCRKYSPQAVALLDRSAVDRLAALLPRPRPELFGGPDGLVAVARDVEADIVLSALVGAAGLLPTMAAIQAGRAVALANKETLVMAGSLMTAAARRRGVALLPVDSEHSAIFQCLVGHNRADVHRILLTGSGGPFRSYAGGLRQRHRGGCVAASHLEDGPKITIDSATLMNKASRSSRRAGSSTSPRPRAGGHSPAVDRPFDGRVRRWGGDRAARGGRHGRADLYALTYRTPPDPGARLDLTQVGQLTFFPPDAEKFPCLRLARAALEQGGSAPVILNAANEVAVAAFLDRRIGSRGSPSSSSTRSRPFPTRSSRRSTTACPSTPRRVASCRR